MKKIIFALLTSTLVLSACGGGATEKEEVVEVKIPVSLACEEGMNEYKVTGTPIQFCYDPAWGAIAVHENPGQAGEDVFISFDGDIQSPTLHYQSVNYVAPETMTFDFCFECLSMTSPNDKLHTQVAEALDVSEDKLSVRKSDVGGVKALRVHANYVHSVLGAVDTITYYVPKAFEGYVMEIYGDNDIATEIDDFVYDVIL